MSASPTPLQRGQRLMLWVEGWPLWLRTILTIAWAGLIWWASSRPLDPDGTSNLPSFVWNSAHVVVFGVLATLLFWTLPGKLRWRIAAAILLAAVYGVVDELHQRWGGDGRTADPWDVASDTFGAALFVCAGAALRELDRSLLWVSLLSFALSCGSVAVASS